MEEDSPLLTPGDDGGAPVKPRADLLTPEDEVGREAACASLLNGARGDKGEQEGFRRGTKRASQILAVDAIVPPAATSGIVGSFGSTNSANKYKKIKKVGVGAYGNVFMAENEHTKEVVAIKVTSRQEDPILGGFPLSLLREIEILRRVSHENIVQIHEIACTPTGEPLIVMEFCQASLLELLNSRKHDLSFSEVKYLTRQLLDATSHLHERGILHRDLATKNVLFNTSGELKVCDFGISRVGFGIDSEYGLLPAANLENPNQIVSLPYRAIELLLGDGRYGPAIDVWSCGCILGEILICQGGLRKPFWGGSPDNQNKTPQMVVENVFEILGKPTDDTWPGLSKLPLFRTYNLPHTLHSHKERGLESSFLRRYFVSGEGACVNTKYRLTESCFDLLGNLLTLCPSDRISAKDALTHSFFTEKPLPEWHAWHWALASKDIPRGDEMKNRGSDELTEGDKAQKLLRQLSREEEKRNVRSDEGTKSLKEQTKEKLERRCREMEAREKAEQLKKAEKVAALAQMAAKAAAAKASANSGGTGPGESVPPGWTKHYSSSKQRYYYHNSKTGENKWTAPTR